jgi:hypothetical protein
MAKYASNDVMDAALAVIAAADRMAVLAGQPASFAQATVNRLAEAVMLPADFTLVAGPAGGRRLQVAARADLLALASGTADHVALLDAAGQRLLYVTTCPPQPLAAGAPVQIAGWQVDIGAPV